MRDGKILKNGERVRQLCRLRIHHLPEKRLFRNLRAALHDQYCERIRNHDGDTVRSAGAGDRREDPERVRRHDRIGKNVGRSANQRGEEVFAFASKAQDSLWFWPTDGSRKLPKGFGLVSFR